MAFRRLKARNFSAIVITLLLAGSMAGLGVVYAIVTTLGLDTSTSALAKSSIWSTFISQFALIVIAGAVIATLIYFAVRDKS